jgi:hypothetical protein
MDKKKTRYAPGDRGPMSKLDKNVTDAKAPNITKRENGTGVERLKYNKTPIKITPDPSHKGGNIVIIKPHVTDKTTTKTA